MAYQNKGLAKEVFISVGHGLVPEEAHFVQLVEACLQNEGITPLLIEKKTQLIADLMGIIRNMIFKSAGTLVIAFERYRLLDIIEYPKSAHIQLAPRSLSTVWNQIEAAMALQIGRPLLILAEKGLHPDGVIDPDIHPVIWFELSGQLLQLPEGIEDVLTEWCKLI